MCLIGVATCHLQHILYNVTKSNSQTFLTGLIVAFRMLKLFHYQAEKSSHE